MTTATVEKNGNSVATETPRNLWQRILDVSAEVGTVAPTGKNFAGGRALSIQDVESSVLKHLINHGVLVRFAQRELQKIDKDWMASITAIVTNADDPAESFEDHWADTGGNPAAAYSYARKSYLKALLHIAEAEDESTPQRRPSEGVAGRGNRSTAPAPTSGEWAEGMQCPACVENGVRSVLKIAKGGRNAGKLQCVGKNLDGSWANHLPPISEEEQAIADAMSVDEIPF